MATVLIIEDERNIRTFVTANLTARGFDVMTAESAEEGLTTLYEKQPSVVILDIFLPNMNGWELLQIMSQDPELKSIPVILMSASVMSLTTSREHYSNVVRQLTKPVSVRNLIDAVQYAVE